MKILFLTYDSIKTPLLHSQGIPLLRELKKKGYKTAILTYEYGKLKEEKQYIKLLDSYNIKWFQIKHSKFYIGPKSSGDILKGIIKVFFIVLKHGYSIIHCRSYIAGSIGLVIAKLLRRKHIFDMRGLYPDEYVLSGYIKKKSKIYRFYKFIEFMQIKFTDKVVVVSNRFASYIKRLYMKKVKDINKKVHIIYNSADLKKFVFSKENRNIMRKKLGIENKFVFVYSGSLAKWHLWKECIKLFYILLKKNKDLFFLFLTYENKDIVKKFFYTLKITDNYFKLINANPDEVNLFLNAADVGIMWIYSDISKSIAVPVKFGEFLGVGLPVIVNSGLMEIANLIQENKIGMVCKDNELEDEKSIIKKFSKFRNNCNEEMRKKCVKVAHRYFNLDNAIEKYISIYNDLW